MKIGMKNKLFAFDLDGTLYFGDTLIKQMVQVVNYLYDRGYQIVYHTNNSGKSVNQIKQKLFSMNYPVQDNVYSSASLMARYCKEERIQDAHIIGSPNLIDMLELEAKINISKTSRNLIVGLTDKFNYEDLSIGLNILINEKNGSFIVCNTDKIFPIEDGRLRPGCGAIVSALSIPSGREPDVIVGKPNSYLLECICEDYEVGAEDIIVIGDSFESDIEMAQNFGCDYYWAYNFNPIIDHIYTTY